MTFRAARVRISATLLGCASLALLGCGGNATQQAASAGAPASAAGVGGSGNASSETQGGSAGSTVAGASNEGGTGNIRTTGERSVPLPRTECPESTPIAGDACLLSNDLSCGYGDSGTWGCRARFICNSGTWEERRSQCTEQSPTCPAQEPQAGAKCIAGGGVTNACAFPSGALCNCYPCDRFSPQERACSKTGTTWVCWQPSPDLDCPLVAPNAGEGCDARGKECTYGDPCAGGTNMSCRSGVWEPHDSVGGCPQ